MFGQHQLNNVSLPFILWQQKSRMPKKAQANESKTICIVDIKASEEI